MWAVKVTAEDRDVGNCVGWENISVRNGRSAEEPNELNLTTQT